MEAMFETLVRLLDELSDVDIGRETAAQLGDPRELCAWVRFCAGKPSRDSLIAAAALALRCEAARRYPGLMRVVAQ